MTYPYAPYTQPFLPTTTVMPTEKDLFVPYFNRTYEAIALTVNQKVGSYFEIPITSSAVNIPNLPLFGAYILCISGTLSTLPCLVVALSKASASASGVVAVLTHQAGTGAWATYVLTVTSTATNFQIAHNNTGVTGNFNIQILGTQG